MSGSFSMSFAVISDSTAFIIFAAVLALSIALPPQCSTPSASAAVLISVCLLSLCR